MSNGTAMSTSQNRAQLAARALATLAALATFVLCAKPAAAQTTNPELNVALGASDADDAQLILTVPGYADMYRHWLEDGGFGVVMDWNGQIEDAAAYSNAQIAAKVAAHQAALRYYWNACVSYGDQDACDAFNRMVYQDYQYLNGAPESVYSVGGGSSGFGLMGN